MTRKVSYWGTYQIDKKAATASEVIHIQIYAKNVAWQLLWFYYTHVPQTNDTLSIVVARKDYTGSAAQKIMNQKVYTTTGNNTWPDDLNLDFAGCHPQEKPLIIGDCLRFQIVDMDATAQIIIYLNAIIEDYAVLECEVFGAGVDANDYTITKTLQRVSGVI